MLKSRIFILTSLFAVFLAGCMPMGFAPTPAPVLVEPPAIPVTGVAVVESVDIQVLESQPVQVNAIIRGQLPDAGCTTIASVNQVRNGNTITITLVTTTDPLALCAQALTPFEQVVPLDVSGLQPGRYTVNANGIEQSFALPARDASQFNQMLLQALNARDYELLKSMMDSSFMISYWLSEGTTNTPEQAIELLQRSLLSSASPISTDPAKNLVELLGTDPVKIVGPDVIEANPLFTTGWGAEGKDEVILFTAKRPNGDLYWYGMLFAKDGFAQSSPISQPIPTTPPQVNQPLPDPEEIPTISILAVTRDESVTVRTHNYPADTKFYVYMGKSGTKAINGILVETFNSRKGGSLTMTFDIPEKLREEKQIAIRLESKNGYFSYDWFTNATSEISATEALPTDVKYVVARQDISVHSGPAKKYKIVDEVDEGDILRVTGVSVDGKWWRVVCPDASKDSCWVFARPAFTRPTDGSGY